MFLAKVYRHHKAAFIIMILFVAGYAWSLSKGMDMLPFRNNAMFISRPVNTDTVTFTLFKVNGQTVDYANRTYWKKDLTEMSILTYVYFIRGNYVDVLGEWLKGKISNGRFRAYCLEHLCNTKASTAGYPAWLYAFLFGQSYESAGKPNLQIVYCKGVLENNRLVVKDSIVYYNSNNK